MLQILNQEKLRAKRRMPCKQYEAARPWTKSGMLRQKWEGLVLLIPGEAVDALKWEADADRLVVRCSGRWSSRGPRTTQNRVQLGQPKMTIFRQSASGHHAPSLGTKMSRLPARPLSVKSRSATGLPTELTQDQLAGRHRKESFTLSLPGYSPGLGESSPAHVPDRPQVSAR